MSLREFLLISAMAIVTLLIRYPVIALSGRIHLSPQFLQLLHHVPPAVLMAITIPAVLMPTEDELELSYTNARLVGAFIALAVGWWRNNLLLTIVSGMLSFFAWQWMISVK